MPQENPHRRNSPVYEIFQYLQNGMRHAQTPLVYKLKESIMCIYVIKTFEHVYFHLLSTHEFYILIYFTTAWWFQASLVYETTYVFFSTQPSWVYEKPYNIVMHNVQGDIQVSCMCEIRKIICGATCHQVASSLCSTSHDCVIALARIEKAAKQHACIGTNYSILCFLHKWDTQSKSNLH